MATVKVQLSDPQVENWPGGALFTPEQLTGIQSIADNAAVASQIVNGGIGAGFDSRPYQLGFADPVQATALYSGTITGMTIISDQPGSCVIQIYKSSAGGFPSFLSIVAGTPPTLSSVQLATDTTLTGWTTAVTEGDIFLFVLVSASTIEQVVVTLTIEQGSTTGSGSGGGTGTAGVTSLSKSGSPHLTGDVTLTGGANVTLTQTANNIQIASSGGGGSPAWNPVLFAQPSGTHLAANTLLIMNSATD